MRCARLEGSSAAPNRPRLARQLRSRHSEASGVHLHYPSFVTQSKPNRYPAIIHLDRLDGHTETRMSMSAWLEERIESLHDFFDDDA